MPDECVAQKDSNDSKDLKVSKRKRILLHGDCLEKLKKIPDNSIDSVVTDPPYESKGFMGKKWDGTGIAYNIDLWKEVLRVLRT